MSAAPSWYAVFRTDDGALQSLGTVVADPLPAGLAVAEVGGIKPEGPWNPVSRTFDAPAPAPVVMLPQDFMGLFTVAEETAIRACAMADAVMQTFLARVQRARSVTLNHPDTVAGLNYCLAKACITQARVDEILNWSPTDG